MKINSVKLLSRKEMKVTVGGMPPPLGPLCAPLGVDPANYYFGCCDGAKACGHLGDIKCVPYKQPCHVDPL